MKNTNLEQYLEETRPTDSMRDSILEYYNSQVGYEGIRFNPLLNKFQYNTSMIEDQVNCSEANELYLVTQVLRHTSYILDFSHSHSKQEMIYWYGSYSKTTLVVIVDFNEGRVELKYKNLKTTIKFNNLKELIIRLEILNIELRRDDAK